MFHLPLLQIKESGNAFEVHSKTPISDKWKQWFRKKGHTLY